jgi:hypothetical protein
LVVLVVLALSACGGDEKKAKAHPLPEDPKPLRSGEYRSEEFKPSLSFRVGKGWSTAPPETTALLHIRWKQKGGIGFLKFQQVYKPTSTGTENLVEAPKDMVGWFQHHPYLQTTTPEPATVGGAKGKRFDISLGHVPGTYTGVCGLECVDIGKVGSDIPPLAIHGYEKARVIVLEDMEGETVTIASNSATSVFHEFTPEAQKVIDSIKWTGS